MAKINYSQLSIEITRACNMNCPHCMRGDGQNKDTNLTALSEFLDNTESVYTVTLTGGEPSIRVPVMNAVLEMFKEKQVPIYGFYLVTNGLEISDEFMKSVLSWYLYAKDCGAEDDNIGIALSRDNYHDEIPPENETLLRAFSFFREDKFVDWDRAKLKYLGRTAEYFDTYNTQPVDYNKNLYVDEFDDTLNIDNNIALTVDGDILSDCDYAYDDIEALKIGNAFDMKSYIRYIRSQVEQ